MLASRSELGEGRRTHASASPAERVLSALPGLTLRLDATGRVLDVWGQGCEGAPGLKPGDQLTHVFRFAPALTLLQALSRARCAGVAQIRIPLDASGAAPLGLDLVRGEGDDLIARLTDMEVPLVREVTAEAARCASEVRSAGESRFLANLTHELRTPLNVIMGFADTMREETHGPLPPRYRGYVDLIHESGELLIELIGDVLDRSRIEADRLELHPEIFDARETAAAVIRLMRGQIDRAGLTLDIPEMRERIEVRADRRALKQIALNLLSNAIKATPSGGRIQLSCYAMGGDLVLCVSDTGRGIPAEDLCRLGHPFEQAGSPEQRAAGTGLGLSLVKALAGLHGGSLSLQSRPWEGTTATVRLPIAAADPAQQELDCLG